MTSFCKMTQGPSNGGRQLLHFVQAFNSYLSLVRKTILDNRPETDEIHGFPWKSVDFNEIYGSQNLNPQISKFKSAEFWSWQLTLIKVKKDRMWLNNISKEKRRLQVHKQDVIVLFKVHHVDLKKDRSLSLINKHYMRHSFVVINC